MKETAAGKMHPPRSRKRKTDPETSPNPAGVMVLENLGDGFFTMNRNWEVSFFNRKAEAFTGMSRSQILGRNFWEVFPTAKTTIVYTEYHRALREQVPVSFEMYSSLFGSWYQVEAYPFSEGLGVYFRDINQKKYYQELERLEREVLERNTRRSDIGSLLECYLLGIENLHRGIKCSVLERRDERLYPLASVSLPDTYLARLRAGIPIADNMGSCGTAAYLREQVVVEDIATDPRWADFKELALDHGLQACWSIPILDSAGAVMATFGLFYGEAKLPSELEQNTIRRAANLLHIILENRRREEELKQTNRRYELATLATRDVLWDCDLRTGQCYYGYSFEELFGYPIVHIDESFWRSKIHPGDRELVEAYLEAALQDRTRNHFELPYRFLRHDGSVAFVLDRCFIERDEGGQAVRLVGAMQDITGTKTVEEELKRLSLVATETSNAVVITDASERIIWVNRAFLEISEYSLDEVVGRKPAELLQSADTCPQTKAYLRSCIEAKSPFNCEILNRSKTGKEYWIELKGQPIFDEKGELQQFFAIQTDVSARKTQERAVKASEEKYRKLFFHHPRPKWIYEGSSFRIVEVNDAALQLYGYSRAEFLSLSIPQLKAEGEQSQTYENFLSHNKTGFQHTVQHRKKDGSLFYIDLHVQAMDLPEGRFYVVVGEDLTDRLRLQQMVIEEKINGHKEIARAIIDTQERERSEIGKELHDNVNQLLTTAKLYVENIRYFPEQGSAFTDKSVALLQQSIDEIRFLSKQLVTPVMKDVGFHATIEELVSHYRALNRFAVELEYDMPHCLLEKGWELTIYRIIQEQMNNIIKYAQATEVRIGIVAGKGKLDVTVQDNGIGFDMTTVTSGLGLNNIRNRGEMYRGTVSFDSAPGQGCLLRVQFPLN